jgi:hypothetical protein
MFHIKTNVTPLKRIHSTSDRGDDASLRDSAHGLNDRDRADSNLSMLNGAAPTNTTLTNATAGVLGAALPALGSSRGSSGVTGKLLRDQ